MGIFEIIKKAIIGEPGGADGKELTNEEIMNVMVKRFEWEVKHRSVGNRMIYPMTFTVVMHNNDFEGRMIELQMVMPEVVHKFYEIILKYKDKFKNYINPADYWTFRFIPSMSEEMELGGKSIHVEEGKLFVITNISDEKDTDDAGENMLVSMPVDKTGVVKKVNINLAAFGKFVSKDEPITIDWTDPDKAVNGVENTPLASNVFTESEKKPVVSAGNPISYSDLTDMGSIFKGFNKGNDTFILAYKLNGELYTYEINSNECMVSGEGADNTKPDIFVVKSGKVKSPHLRIRKNFAENKYYVAAFAPTSIEEVQLPVSTPDAPKWVPLGVDVNINMNTFVVRFMKKH